MTRPPIPGAEWMVTMVDFFAAVGKYSFLQYALLTGLLSSVACGVVGSYVVSRRISYVAEPSRISFCAGWGGAIFPDCPRLDVLQPLHGAVVSALWRLLSCPGQFPFRQREDTSSAPCGRSAWRWGALYLADAGTTRI